MNESACKICGSGALKPFAHTATCQSCGALLYYPYPDERSLHDGSGGGTNGSASNGSASNGSASPATRAAVLEWYARSAFRNHDNFTNMLRFAVDEGAAHQPLHVLDYGGGGGQFALVCRSHLPLSHVYITDISDAALLREWQGASTQIPFAAFATDRRTFDLIFLNDVFEHLYDPRAVLSQLSTKLAPGGRLFIDTPRQFWLYPVTRLLSRSLHEKLLHGTVSRAHLQIWTKRSLENVIAASGLRLLKYEECSEYTMPADYYLRNMRITHPALQWAGRTFYANARWLAKNKIMCVLAREGRDVRAPQGGGSKRGIAK